MKSDMSLVSYDSTKANGIEGMCENQQYLFSDDIDSEKAPSADAIVVERASMTSKPEMSGRSGRSSGMIVNMNHLS